MSKLPETTQAWLRQTAKFEGAVTAQVLLHLLERMDAKEARDGEDANCWASVRQSIHRLRERIEALEQRPIPGTAGYGRLLITARTTAAGTPQAQWLVQFTRWRWGSSGKMLDQCAAWMPTLQAWDRGRWHPIGSRLIPPAVLADVEDWLRGRPVGEAEATTTTETQ